MIVGITGRAGAGKNTFAEALIAHTGGIVMSFADPLRDVAQAAFGSRYTTHAEKDAVDPFWNGRCVEASRSATQVHGLHLMGDQAVTGRRILQFIGTEMFRNMVHPDFWVMALARRVEALKHEGTVVAIPDVRFDNEAQWIREQGGLVVHLNRLNLPPAKLDHVSEKGVRIELWSELIDTNSTEETRTAAVQLAQQHRLGPPGDA